MLVTPDLNPAKHPQPLLQGKGGLWVGRFQAMASDCELLMEGVSEDDALLLLKSVAIETWRIEHKFSRYIDDNIIQRINAGNGATVTVDDETAGLLDFADQCYQLSNGMFDITSGVLRRIWRFDGGDQVPSHEAVKKLQVLIGWQKVQWHKAQTGHKASITLPQGMEIDLGGIGKEYAVDKVIQLIQNSHVKTKHSSFVVNFGGDLACTGPRLNTDPWVIGVESSNKDDSAVAALSLSAGAVATSGDSRRYIMHKGKKLSHILNPLTAWPVKGTPSAISVAAPGCLQAGLLSTLAMLHGEQAEAFLKAQNVEYWIQA